jgi:hypothetical protein
MDKALVPVVRIVSGATPNADRNRKVAKPALSLPMLLYEFRSLELISQSLIRDHRYGITGKHGVVASL